MGTTINVTVNSTDITVTPNDVTINVTVSSVATGNFVNEDVSFKFDGTDGDTYLKYNSTTAKLELFVDGRKKAQWG